MTAIIAPMLLFKAAIVVGSIAYQQRMQRKARREAQRAAEARKGFDLVVESEIIALGLPMGRFKVGGTRVFRNTANSFIYTTPNSDKQFLSGSPNVPAGTYEEIVSNEGGTTTVTVSYSAIDGSILTKSISGSKNEYLFTQQALCVGPITSIYDFLIDDSIDLNDPSIGSVAPPSGAINGAIAPSNNPQNKGALRIDVHYGNILKADAISSVNFATRAEAKFPGMSYASCVFKLDRDNPQFQNVPNVTFFGEGIKAPTVSNGTISTSLTYTTNPARLLLYYLLYIRGLSADEIDVTSFESAQAICDRVVGTFPVAGKIWQPLDGSRNITTRQLPRFECNIVLDTNVPHRENYSQILSTMGDARLVRSGGKYKLKIQDPATNNDIQFAGEITEADIVKNNTIEISGPSSQDKLNHAVVRFLNESLDFKEDFASWPPKTNGTFFKGIGNAPYPSVDGWDDTYTGGKLLNTYGVWNSNSTSASFSWKFLVKNTGAHILNFTADNSCTVTIKNSTYTHSNVNSFANITLNLTKDEIVTISATASNSNADGKFGFAGRILDSLNYIVWNSRSIIYTDFIQQTYSNSVYQTYFEEDSNVEAETDVFLNGVTTYQHALAHAEELVRTSRNRLSIKFTYWMLDKIYESGDFIKLNLPSYDINDLPIKVDTAKPNTDGSCEIVAESFDASNIAWNVGDDQIVSPRNYFNFNIPMPANLTVIRANIYLKDSSGRVEWSPSSDSRVKSHIIYVHRTGDKDSTGRPVFVEIGRSSGNTFDLPKLSFVSGMIGVRAVAGNSLSDMNVTESVLFNERTLALSQTASLFSKISSTLYDPATIQLTAITTGYLAPVYQWYEDNQLIGGGDQYFSNVSLLLHLDGSNNSTVFTDSSSNNVTVTAFNSTKLSTTQSKFGSSSAVFNNTGNWQNDGGTASVLRAADSSLWDYGSNDFSIEAWIYLIAYPLESGGIVGKNRDSADFGEYVFAISSAGQLTFGANTGGETNNGWSLVVLVSSAAAVALNTWQHVAVTRSGTTFRLFVNGSIVATANASGSIYNGTAMLTIGSNKDNGQFGFNGYIDEVRITKGIARYTANFTPPSSQFSNILGNSSNTLTVNPFSAGVTKEYKVVVEEQGNLGDSSTLLSESVSIFSIDLSAASKNTIVLSPPSANIDYVPGIGISSNPSTQISVVDANGNDVTNNYNLSKVDSGLSTTINNNILTVNSIGNPDSAYGVFLARMNGVTDDEGPYSIKSSAMGTDVVISSTGGPLPNTGRAIFNGNNNGWGSGGSIVYPVPPEMMPTDSNISVSFWIKFDDVNQSVYQPLVTGFLRISFYGNNYISGWGPYMTFEILGSQPNVYNSYESPTLFANVSTPNTGANAIPWSSNTWYFIEGTYDKTTSKVYLFRDGIKLIESNVQPTNASIGFLYQRRAAYNSSRYTFIAIGATPFTGYSYGTYGSISEFFIQINGAVNTSNYVKPAVPRLSVIPSSTNLSNIVATPKLSGSPINTNFYVYSTIKSGPVIDIIQSRSSGIVDADWDNSNQSYTSAAMSYRILVDGVDQTNLWQVRAAHDGQSPFMQMSVTPGNFSVNYKQNTDSMFVSFIVGRSGYKTQLFEYLVQTSFRQKATVVAGGPSTLTIQASSQGIANNLPIQFSITALNSGVDEANQYLWTVTPEANSNLTFTNSGNSSTINLTGATNYSKDSFLVTITGTRSGWPNLVHTLTVNRIRAAQSSLTLSPQKSIVESDYYGNVVNWSSSTTTATVTAPSGANETSAWSYFIHAVNNVNATLDGAFNNRINITGFDLNTVNNNHKFYSLLIPGDENINDYSMYQRVFTADSNVTFESSGSPVGGGFVKVPPNRTGNFDQKHYAITYGIDTDPSFVDVSGQPWDLKMFLRVNTQPRSMTDYICQNSVITITVITSGTGVYIRALWTWRNKNQFSANQTTTALNSSTLSLNNWVEVRFSYCSDGLLRLWLDGVLQASSNIGQNKYHGQSGYYDNWNRTWYFGDYGHSGSGRIISFDFCEFYLAYGLSGPLTSSYSVQYSKIIPVNSPKSAFVTLRADKANEVSLYATTDISIVPKSQPSITISSQPTFLTLPATWDGVVTGSSATAVVTVLVDGVDDTANWGFVFDYDHNGSLGASISNSSIYLTTGSIFQTAIRVYASRPGFTTKMIKIPVSLSRGVQPTVISSGTTSIQVISDWDDTNRLNLPITCSVVALEGSTVVTSNYNWSISASSGITLNNYYGSSVNLIDMNSGINSGTITFTGSRTSWPKLSWRVTVSKLLNTQPIVLLSGTSSLQVQANWNDTDILNLPLLGSVVATDQSTGVIVTNNYTWTITASSGITANNSGSQFSITNMSSGTLSGTITMTATRSQWPTLTWTVQITKIFAAQPIVTLTGPTSATIAGATDGSVPSSSLPVSVSLTAVGPTTNENSNYIWSLTSTSGITANINNSAVVQITAINSNTDTGTITVTGTRTGWPSLVWYISVNKTRLLSPSGDAANWSADCFATAFSTATGRIIIKSDGTVVYKINQSAERYSTNWYTPTTIGIGNSRWMKYSVISGASPGVGSLAPNTLVQLTSDQTISLVQSGMGYTDGQYLVEIYSNSAGTTKVSEGTVYIVAEIS